MGVIYICEWVLSIIYMVLSIFGIIYATERDERESGNPVYMR